jgi:hypothetical protein
MKVIKKTIIYTGLFLVFCGSRILAAPITVKQAEDVSKVKTFVWNSSTEKFKAASITGDYTVKETLSVNDSNNITRFYISNLKPEGFIKKDINNRLRAVPVTEKEVKEKNNELWKNYLNDRKEDNKKTSVFRAQSITQWPSGKNDGWLDTTWDQSSPYNDKCPMDIDQSSRSVAGCVAIAIAQVAQYHKFPKQIILKDEHRYITETREINIDDDSDTHDFPDFEEVNNKLAEIDYSDVGEYPYLVFAVGVMVEMDYKSSSSGAVPTADDLTVDLNFENAIDAYGYKNNFYQVLKDDIKNARPALLGIEEADGSGDHMIVADGYRISGEYHLNFGWGNSNPGGGTNPTAAWYSLPEGMPAGYSIITSGILKIEAPGTYSNSTSGTISFPNPYNINENSRVTIALPDDAEGDSIEKTRIYTIGGNLVKELEGGITSSWNGRNESDNVVNSGLYLYAVRTEMGKIYRGKITLLR